MADLDFIIAASAVGEALIIMAAYSFLYKENPFFRIMESIYVGVGVGWALATSIFNMHTQRLPPFYRDPYGLWWYSLAIILGLFWYTYWSRKWFFLYRIPLSFEAGLNIGTALYGTVYSMYITQITATFRGFGATPLDTLNNIVITIGTLTAITFFYFSREHTGLLGYSSRIGRYFILIFLGSAFGNTIMGRTALVIMMAQELLKSPQWLMVPIVLVVFVGIEVLKKLGYLREFSPAVSQAFSVRAKGEAAE